MFDSLPAELIHLIVEALRSQNTFAALCRVSKSFHRIFTPFLYEFIRVEDYDRRPTIKKVSHFKPTTHLCHTKEPQIGNHGYTCLSGCSKVELDTCLLKMKIW